MYISKLELVALATFPIWPFLIGQLKLASQWVESIVVSLFFTCVKVDDALAGVLSGYLPMKYKQVKFFASYNYVEGRHFVRPLGKFMSVLFRNRDLSTSLFLIGRAPVLFVCNSTGSEVNESLPGRMWFIKGTVNHEEVIRSAQQAYEELTYGHESNRFVIYRVSGQGVERDRSADDENSKYAARQGLFNEMSERLPVGFEPDEIGVPHNNVALSRLFLTPPVQDLVDEVKFWFNAEDWFEERGVPWKRGYLLHGPPGTGKSSVVRALAEELDIPLWSFDLASMDNDSLIEKWQEVSELTPAVILLEDIDAVFNGRENITKDGEVTFDCLLNCIDGASTGSGILLFITTNNPERLDSALAGQTSGKISTRPGRVDRAVLVEGLTPEGRYKLALRILKNEKTAKKVANEFKDDTPAQLQERCFQMASKELFKSRGKVA